MKWVLSVWVAAGMFTFGHFYAVGTAAHQARVEAAPLASLLTSVLFWPAQWGAVLP